MARTKGSKNKIDNGTKTVTLSKVFKSDFQGNIGQDVTDQVLGTAYTASLKSFGKTFTAEGDTIFQAIANLEPGNIRGRAILTLSRGGKTKERILMPMAAIRLFNSGGLTREVQIKNTAMTFQGFDA